MTTALLYDTKGVLHADVVTKFVQAANIEENPMTLQRFEEWFMGSFGYAPADNTLKEDEHEDGNEEEKQNQRAPTCVQVTAGSDKCEVVVSPASNTSQAWFSKSVILVRDLNQAQVSEECIVAFGQVRKKSADKIRTFHSLCWDFR